MCMFWLSTCFFLQEKMSMSGSSTLVEIPERKKFDNKEEGIRFWIRDRDYACSSRVLDVLHLT